MSSLIFIKFGRRERIEKLARTGGLFLQALHVYKGIETPEIGDPYEGALKLETLDNATLKVKDKSIDQWINVGGVKWLQYREDNSGLSDLNVYCLYSLMFDQADDPQIGKNIDERVLRGFGDAALVILDVPEFLKRVKAACESKGFEFMHAHVEYVSLRDHTGEVGPFRKDESFEHQREFRIAVLDPDRNGSPLRLQLGSLKDISAVVPSEQAANLIFKVDKEEVPE